MRLSQRLLVRSQRSHFQPLPGGGEGRPGDGWERWAGFGGRAYLGGTFTPLSSCSNVSACLQKQYETELHCQQLF